MKKTARYAGRRGVLERSRDRLADYMRQAAERLWDLGDRVETAYCCERCEGQWYFRDGAEEDGTRCPDCTPVKCTRCGEVKRWAYRRPSRGVVLCRECAAVERVKFAEDDFASYSEEVCSDG